MRPGKIDLGAKTFLYPMPATLVGAIVDGKPNIITIANCGCVDQNPPMLAVGINQAHYTNKGIIEQKAFSVNIPSANMVTVTDYCGLASGRNIDKSEIFDIFYGQLKNAPMISECPVCMECKLFQHFELPHHDVFIGEIVATYSEKKFLKDGLPDIRKIDPIVYSHRDRNYWRFGEHLGRAWKIGKQYGPLK